MQFLIAGAGALEALRVAAVGVEGRRFGAFLFGDLLLHFAEGFGGHFAGGRELGGWRMSSVHSNIRSPLRSNGRFNFLRAIKVRHGKWRAVRGLGRVARGPSLLRANYA